MNKIVVFDMDGTLGDFYGVEGWLDDLNNHRSRPYAVAEPRVDMEALNAVCEALRNHGWKIVITTWLAKNSNPAYDAEVREVKKEWLARYGFRYDEFHGVRYGATKADSTRRHKGYQVLVDDNEKIRKGWHLGDTIDANGDFLGELVALITKEV